MCPLRSKVSCFLVQDLIFFATVAISMDCALLLVLFVGSGWFVDVSALFTDVSCSWGLAGLLVMAADVYMTSSSLVFLITSRNHF